MLFDITPLTSRYNRGVHCTRNWYAKHRIFWHFDADAFAVASTKAQIENGEHLLFVHCYIDGNLRGRIGDLNIDREPGYIYFLDQASAVECVQRPAIMHTIFIPKAALGFDPDRHPPLVELSVEFGIGKVVNALFDLVFDGLPENDAIEYDTFNQLIAYLQSGLGEQLSHGDIRAQARQAVRSAIPMHVEQNLDS